jgi:hypothetical protein
LQFLAPLHPEILVINFKQALRPKFNYEKLLYFEINLPDVTLQVQKTTSLLASAIIFLEITAGQRYIAC